MVGQMSQPLPTGGFRWVKCNGPGGLGEAHGNPNS